MIIHISPVPVSLDLCCACVHFSCHVRSTTWLICTLSWWYCDSSVLDILQHCRQGSRINHVPHICVLKMEKKTVHSLCRQLLEAQLAAVSIIFRLLWVFAAAFDCRCRC